MKTRYVVNEEKRTVACIIYDCECDLLDFVCKHSIGQLPISFINGEDWILSSHYSGVAKCAPEDIFDAKIGKDLAYKRARKKYERARMNKLCSTFYSYYKPMNEMLELQNKRLNKACY